MPDRDSPDYGELLRIAQDAARAAGGTALHGFRGDLQVHSKGGTDIVTQYDTMAEHEAVQVVHSRFPSHSILAEEGGQKHGQDESESRWTWTIDPIDGTHNYAMQLPFWCSSVGVRDAAAGEIVAGAVFDPLHNEMFTAARGSGALLNGEAISVSSTAELREAIVAQDIGYEPAIARRMMRLAARVQPQVKRIRLLGSAVLAIAYVAAGRFDAYYHLSLQPWDVAAASLLVREAGGLVTDWSGGPLPHTRTSAVLASRSLQPKLLALLTGAGE